MARLPGKRTGWNISLVFLARLAWVVAALHAFPVLAEIIHLNDGGQIEGAVKRTAEGYDVTDATGKVTHVDLGDVRRIELGSKPKGVVEAESRLQSLRRSVENLADLKAIIDRYSRFVDQNKDSPIGKDAELDLAAWRERQEAGKVKVGSRWVTVAEREELRKNGAVLALQARQLMLQSRVKDAEAVLQQALEEDPGNLSATYLRASVLFKQDQLTPARKGFEAILATLKEHGPTLNNLAVVLWRQNQPLPAMNFYAQAMLAVPGNRDVLNNVAEALNALPQNQRGSAPAQKAFRIFTDQDTLLQQEQAKSGLYRWGSTWVEKAQIEKLQAMEKEIQKALDAMSADYDAMQKKIDGMEADIAANARRMKSMEAESLVSDSKGNLMRMALPSRYYEMDRENRQLSVDRDALGVKQNELRAKAKVEQQKLPTPKFTMVHRLIGPEGAPLLPPVALNSDAPKPRLPAIEPPHDIRVIPAPTIPRGTP